MKFFSPAEIPGYLEAVQQERLVRDAALLDITETVNGFELKPLTLRNYLCLRIANSPMLPPYGVPNPVELAQFLWLLSTDYCFDQQKRKRFLKRCQCFTDVPKPIFKTKRAMKRWKTRWDESISSFVKTVNACNDYMNEALQDRPAQTQHNGIPEPDYYSDMISICASFGREFGWTQEYLLNLPVKCVFQYLKEMREYYAIKNQRAALLGNPSDRFKSDYLNKLNAELIKN